jgi:hypothetical protein
VLVAFSVDLPLDLGVYKAGVHFSLLPLLLDVL